MKLSMKFFVAALALILGTTAVTAQKRGKAKLSPEEKAEKQTTRMVETLGLNDTQKEEVAAINLEFANKTDMDRKELRTAHHEALATVLTDEQLTTWAETRKGKRGKKGGKARGISLKSNVTPAERAEKMTLRMTESLNLTNEQITAVTSINQTFANNIAAAKTSSDDKKVVKANVKAAKEQHRTALESVLTPEQMKNLKMKGDKCKNGQACKKKSKSSKI